MTLQISSLTSDTAFMVVVGIAAILGSGYGMWSFLGGWGVGVYVAWLGGVLVILALLGGQAEPKVDHSERPAEVLEQARDNNGEQ